jgi:hypothetical protein
MRSETIKHLEGVAQSLSTVGAHEDAEAVRQTINDQKAQRLEELADNTLARIDHKDAALLRESAAMWRERNPDDALWELEYQRRYKRHDLFVGEGLESKWYWSASYRGTYNPIANGDAPSLPAAQAAAVAWVDAQEGK